MRIELVDKHEAAGISAEAWDELAERALQRNPFFERWYLLSALRWLGAEKQIRLVTVVERGKLVALFPVEIVDSILVGRVIKVWKHIHCFLCTPLVSVSVDWRQIIGAVLERQAAAVFVAADHGLDLSEISLRGYHELNERPSINAPVDWDLFTSRFSSKRRKEYRRIARNISSLPGYEYQANIHCGLVAEIRGFAELENLGWKGEQGGALLCRPREMRFYDELARKCEGTGILRFTRISINEEVIAISFAIYCGSKVFELKTTFNERYKRFAPGIALELENIRNYERVQTTFVDSCTSSDNFAIGKMWPDKILLGRSWIFRNPVHWYLFRYAYPQLRRVYRNPVINPWVRRVRKILSR